ncbi:MAG: NAD(P)H-dependent oxidoreductase [Phreatobacter sp.]|uniref:NAD(P)H-dependent oxidoreductase n=1 Tax=Phreatobacter sp. TaxID=1966341 RepID=UPI002736BE02|nr:NAD(P)H-dependent oxidoreductase [Phreatobacter sp.]MDP2802234.1 NAD(P)H-dependent oxidoreductase [Phreatobacter sp.]
MRMLVIYCHPCPESFTAALRDRALAALAAAGHEIRLIDLYGEGFDPVMDAGERRAYHTAGANEAPVAAHLDALRWAEGLLFVYPTWWYGLPAMLKGWLDRVWVPHATFTMPEAGKPIGRVLTQIRFIGAVSTLGSPWWWWRLVMSEPGRRTLLRGLRPLVAPRCRTLWLGLHGIDGAGTDLRTGFLQKVERRLAALR